jgi:predicted NAD/FAD-binding protein
MLLDLLRFYRVAPKLVGRDDGGQTLGDYLDAHNYCDAFVEEHLLPMGAAIWSTTAAQMRAYPLAAFVGFFQSHGLLDLNVTRRPKWRSVLGGSRSYVDRIVAGLDDVRLGAAVSRIRRGFHRVEITDATGNIEIFDDVVIASHADQALKMLDDADGLERTTLGAFRYTDNTAFLHTDATLMPRRKRTWASWNYIGEVEENGERPLCVTYWMNRLQQLETSQQIFVTLNPIRPAAEGSVVEAIHYTHPLFDGPALAAQAQLPLIQGSRNTWFCGSYFGHGFHEDALQSGLAVGEAIGGVSRPWRVDDAANRIALPRLQEAAE